MTNDQKKEVISKITKEIYENYVKNFCILNYLENNFQDELDTDMEELKLKEIELRKKLRDFDKSDESEEAKKEFVNLGIELSNLEGKTKFIEEKQKLYMITRNSLEESKMHYDLLNKHKTKTIEVKEIEDDLLNEKK